MGYERFVHPLTLNSTRLWKRLRRMYGPVSPEYRLKSAVISLLSPLTAPARLQERIQYGRRLRHYELGESPIFILGHWRSGTTHLHNLMCQDPHMAYLTTYQTQNPGAFFAGRYTIRPIMALFLPKKRPMDNMELSPESPQEEEMGMCNLTPCSFYCATYFPHHARELFHKYAMFEDISEPDFLEWRETYMGMLKKASLAAPGKRLVLKNPVNTCRIHAILKIFPDAKFIHIYRDPYAVYKSSIKLAISMRKWMALQTVSDQTIEESVLYIYRQMMTRYFEQRALIPAGNLAEVRYEDLDLHPFEQMERIYQELNLPGWDQVSEPVQRYIASQADYQKNRFVMREADVVKVEENWRFAIDAWGYSRPQLA